MSPPVTRSIRNCTLVSVDADAAFRMFTEEVHAWYRVDQFTVMDHTKTVSLRFEPEVGGRFIDVYDKNTGEGRDIGKITVWDPPKRLVFVDNRGCDVEVGFESVARGTLVSIEVHGLDHLPADEAEHARRHSWHTVVDWFAAHAPTGSPSEYGGLVPYLFYEDAGAMLDWYARVFGFVEISRWTAEDGRVHNAEMSVGDTEIWLDGGGPRRFDKDGKRAAEWIGVWVEDVDAVHKRIAAAGVEVDPPIDPEYGVRMLTVKDPEGYSWGFMQR